MKHIQTLKHLIGLDWSRILRIIKMKVLVFFRLYRLKMLIKIFKATDIREIALLTL